MQAKAFGKEALSGWRVKVGHPVAVQVAKRTRLKEEQVESAIGAFFLLSSIWYVVTSIRGAIKKG